MTSNEVCVLCYQIAGADGLVAETQVRTCDTAGFLCVIFKISLCVFICVVTDDFDGVFVCANRTVGAKTPEFAGYGACVSQIGLCANLDGAVGNIINDTNESLEKLCKNMKDKIAEQEKIVKTNQYELKGQLQDLSDTEKYLKIIDDRNKEIERQKNAGKPVEERTIDKEEKSIYANRQTEIKVNMDYIRKLGLAEGEDLGDGVVGEVKLADDTPDAGSNHSNDKDEAKAAGSKSSVDEDYKAISRKAGNPPVINTKEGKELTDGIHRMWQSITGNKGK